MKRPGIYGFNGPNRYLSNFFIEPDGTHVEGEYQRAKCRVSWERDRFHLPPFAGSNKLRQEMPMMSPDHCKRQGLTVHLREDWEDVKVDIMLFYVTKKFKDHPQLAEQLRQTRGLYLEETNHWRDTFWGVCNGKGLNMLGAILMQVRDEL